MIFAPPAFWHKHGLRDETLSLALAPLGMAYGFLSRKRFDLHFPVPLEKPVVCVGNITMGGAGKTPVALSLADLLKDKGWNPHFLTRGYGGTEKGPLQVAPSRDTSADVGDEALLLVEKAPTWVSANRALGAQTAIDTGANVVILDDGYQNPALYKDFALVVIDGGSGFGNGRVFPAGPLREDIAFSLSRADAVVIVGDDLSNAAETVKRHAAVPLLHAHLEPEADNPDVSGREIFAFAGIGRPEKFRKTLEKAGAKIEGWGSFPDHFAYIKEDLKALIEAAEKKGLMIVTTAKDYVRLPPSLRPKVKVFRVRLVWDTPEVIADLIDTAIRRN
jgi:tetraacyldisaccharide 4'-kinase